ncbi:GAF domain-containing protein [Roseobacter sp. YSTF-M11]|uniref:histidine kinase n=1 Tax=Roseobacter insulae TaxID=2859783 RepID=A0A9X1FUF2_9RHOB|nr:HWE histidine kinase domain-containing protein [Roseobacter insulae]MBW4708110.1 GAF domain-containing protein [Roseobacter insulae]
MDQSAQAAELEAAIENCAAEPVHIPGTVQPFSCLVASDMRSGTVLYASENCADPFGMPLENILGGSLQDMLGREFWHELRNTMSRSDRHTASLPVGTFELGGETYDARAHETDGKTVVELETASAATMGGASALKSLNFVMTQVQECDSVGGLCDLTVDLMRHLTGFDRVMIYKFDADYNGEVIAETCRASMEPCLGLRFPSWDIPAQAREIMKRTRVRLIGDVDQDPIPVVAARATLPPLDMTFANSRGVSPVHLQYLRNMGCKASMTLNIVVEDTLWGIISFQHRKPKICTSMLRELLESFVPIFASKLLTIRQKDTLQRIKILENSITSQPGVDTDLDHLLPEVGAVVLDVVGADGITTLSTSALSTFGVIPKRELLDQLLALSLERTEDVIAIESLAELFPQYEDQLNGCAGALVATILPDRAISIFRLAVKHKVSWAGNPEKTIELVSGVKRLSPRASFSHYLEDVKGRSKAWTEDDIHFIQHVRTLLHASERQSLLNTMNRQQALMIDELNHRVRNILALVRSVSRQARRRYGSLNSYAAAMENRIRALAASHDLSAASLSHPVSIKSLILKEFEPFGTEAAARATVTGKDRNMLADVAPIFSLVMHELTTNAAKYGALTAENGMVDITLEWLPDATRIVWKEQGGPPVVVPNDTGFGTAMIEQAVPHEFGGKAILTLEPDGVRAELIVPDRFFDDRSEPAEILRSHYTQVPFEAEFCAKSINGTVLLVEDNFIIAKEMSDQLREFGFSQVALFANAEDALEHVETEVPVLAVLDYNLGGQKNSLPVAQKMLELSVPVVFVTGYGEHTIITPELKHVPMLIKPVAASELKEQFARIFS